MAAVNIGALPEYDQHQGVLRCTGPRALGQVDCMPAATIAATSKVKLARKAQADNRMEVDGDKRRRSSDVRLSMPKVPPQFRSLPCFPTQWYPWNHHLPSRWPRAHFYHRASDRHHPSSHNHGARRTHIERNPAHQGLQDGQCDSWLAHANSLKVQTSCGNHLEWQLSLIHNMSFFFIIFMFYYLIQSY